MLSPEYLAQLPEPLIRLWQLVEDDILRDIGRRIRKMDKLTDTAAYQAFRLEQTKLLHTDIVKLIAKHSGKSETAIRKMLSDAAVETLRSEDAIHAAAGVILPPINESENLKNLLNAGYRQTIGTWKNLTATTANTVTRQFEDALDRAWLQISSGAFDYQTAVKNAVDDLAQHMDGVTYPSGHHDTLEVAVRRAALTGVNQTCGKLQWERMEQAGCEFVEVTAHSGARDTGTGPANHANWQGKVYHVGGAIWHEGVYYEDFVTATGYGTGEGLCGWNCRHNFCSFWPGISTRVYTDEQLAELSAKNIEYNGNMYSRYEINQMQRERERNVRKWKKTWMIEKEAGLDTTTSAIHLKNARKNLSNFAKATGGRVDSSRLSSWNTSKLPGKRFGHSEATSANWDVRKEEQRKAAIVAAAEEKRMQLARADETFYIVPPLKGDAIKAQSIYKELQKSEVGQHAYDYIIKNNIPVEINYTDEVEKDTRGVTYGHSIFIYAKNTRTVKLTTQTIIHEVAHIELATDHDTQWEEAYCFAQEEKHIKKVLTYSDLKDIIKTVKRLYPEYPWR